MSEFTNKNIWVFIETDEGKAKSVGLELLNPGRMLAEKSGEKLVAVVFGKDNAEAIEQIKGYGPDQIISVSGGEYEKYSFDAYTYAMTSLVEKYQPSAILIGATNNGRDFAPRLSCRLRTGLTASTPLRFTVSIFEPNCGRANISITNVNAAKVSQNLMSGRYLEIVGMSPFSNAGSPYLRIFWRR
jgi:hypothetical protein